MHSREVSPKNNRRNILSSFRFDKLHAPFTINLIDSVEETYNTENAELEHHIPDQQDLLHSIILYRTVEANKMKGSDIKFLRKSLGLRAFEVSKPLSISREHFSRCENDNVPMSNSLETLIRVFIMNKISTKLGSKLLHREMTLQSAIDLIFNIEHTDKNLERHNNFVLNLKRNHINENMQFEKSSTLNFAWIKADF